MSAGSRKKRQSVSQTVGGVLFGFEQQVMRTTPPPEELVHHARPDAPLPAGDGSFVTLELPEDLAEPGDLAEPENPWAGYEDLLEAEDGEGAEEDPWADLAAEAAPVEAAVEAGSADAAATREGNRPEG
jgi:hypothetical protein